MPADAAFTAMGYRQSIASMHVFKSTHSKLKIEILGFICYYNQIDGPGGYHLYEILGWCVSEWA